MTVDRKHRLSTPPVSTVLICMGFSPIAVLFSCAVSNGIRAFFLNFCKIEMALCFIAGTAAMTTAYMVYFAGKRSFAQRLLENGINLLVWAVIAIFILAAAQRYS